MALGQVGGASQSKASKKQSKKSKAKRMAQRDIAVQQRDINVKKGAGKLRNATYIDGPLAGKKVGQSR